jgi:hypothetical protein
LDGDSEYLNKKMPLVNGFFGGRFRQNDAAA